jgi:hypothetical protein
MRTPEGDVSDGEPGVQGMGIAELAVVERIKPKG